MRATFLCGAAHASLTKVMDEMSVLADCGVLYLGIFAL